MLIPPASGKRKDKRPGWDGGGYAYMRAVLASDHAKELYRQRCQTVEPVFGHTKHNQGYSRFLERGRAAVRTEWRLMMTSHNLAKLYRHQTATPGA